MVKAIGWTLVYNKGLSQRVYKPFAIMIGSPTRQPAGPLLKQGGGNVFIATVHEKLHFLSYSCANKA